ncbi:MAG: hypothetical protein GXO26_04240 [Crenarchaeota archaeon]|nr:hypothetical protein [Thermoproteota archaeon]
MNNIVKIIAPLDIDSLDIPYIVKSRPRIEEYVNALNKPINFRRDNIIVRELANVEDVDDKVIREVYTEVHSEDLYFHTRSKPFFRRLMSITCKALREILEDSESRINILVYQPPDLWAGRTFLRKCSIFSISTYIAKKISTRSMILCIDVHFCYGIYDIVMELRDIVKIPTVAVCSLSDLDTKIFRRVKKEPWSVLPIPIPPGSRDDIADLALDLALRLVEKYSPEVLVVPLGLDMYKEDLIGEFMISADFYYDLGYRLLSLFEAFPLKKIVVVTECASSRASIERAFTNFVAGIAGVEKPYHEAITRESSETILNIAKESFSKVRKLIAKFWRIRLRKPSPKI